MSIFNDAGLLIIGSRIKRLGDRFLNEVSRIYKHENIRFEPAWFPVFYLLDKKGSLSLTEIASELDVSHSAISQMITLLQNKKIVEIQPDSSDARIKKIAFSPKGKKLTEQIHPVWEALQISLSQVLPEGISPSVFLQLISHLEEKLSANFISDATLKYIHEQESDIDLKTPDADLKTQLGKWIQNEKSVLLDSDDSLLVALLSNKIAGYTAYRLNDGILSLRYIYVHPFQRRKGTAMQMIRHLYNTSASPLICIEEANLDLIQLLIKSGYSFKVK